MQLMQILDNQIRQASKSDHRQHKRNSPSSKYPSTLKSVQIENGYHKDRRGDQKKGSIQNQNIYTRIFHLRILSGLVWANRIGDLSVTTSIRAFRRNTSVYTITPTVQNNRDYRNQPNPINENNQNKITSKKTMHDTIQDMK